MKTRNSLPQLWADEDAADFLDERPTLGGWFLLNGNTICGWLAALILLGIVACFFYQYGLATGRVQAESAISATEGR